MKIKKIYIIPSILVVLLFIICIILGFAVFKTPELIYSTEKTYKFLNGLKYFSFLLPGVLGFGFFLGFNIDFGQDFGGSRLRFSSAMFRRYKHVILVLLVGVFIVSIVSEIVSPLINSNMRRLENLVKLEKEYTTYAKTLLYNKRYKLAASYAEIATKINPQNKDSAALLNEAKIGVSQDAKNESKDMVEILAKNADSLPIKKLSEINIPYTEQEPYTSVGLLSLARKCFEKKDWFGAHFYAQTAISISSERDLNLLELKQISSDAWNMISSTKEQDLSPAQKTFAKKYKGYNALMENDNLGAYYIFRGLERESKQNSIDPDIIRYLEISRTRLLAQHFFTDETYNIRGFEVANDIYFKIKRDNGYSEIYYIKGLTNADKKNDFVQYLRGFSMFQIDEKGNYVNGAYSPYAKMLTIKTDNFDSEAKKSLGITNEMKNVPYIILRSVDRDEEDRVINPILLKGEKNIMEDGFVILPMEASDFNVLKESSDGLDAMSINSIFRMNRIAKKYGFAKEVYSQAILNRLLYPLFCLASFVILAIYAWNTRLSSQLFKFKWALPIPVLAGVFVIAYGFILVSFKLMNYFFLSVIKSDYVIFVALIYYIIIFVGASVVFLSCRNSGDN